MVAAPLLDSSSGWACTAIKRSSLTRAYLLASSSGLVRTRSTVPGGPIVPVLVLRSESRPTPGAQPRMIERPAARYGRQRLSRPSRRRLAIGLFLLVVVVGVVIAF